MKQLVPAADSDLAHWLKEVGSRPQPRRIGHEHSVIAAPSQVAALRRLVQALDRFRMPLLLVMFSVAFLQYYFADVLLEIESLHSLIVFSVFY